MNVDDGASRERFKRLGVQAGQGNRLELGQRNAADGGDYIVPHNVPISLE
jgi:hypothetical protein